LPAEEREQPSGDDACFALALVIGLASGFLGGLLPWPIVSGFVLSSALVAWWVHTRRPLIARVLLGLALFSSGHVLSVALLADHLSRLPGDADLGRSYQIRARVLDDWETPYGWAVRVDRIRILSPEEVPFQLERLTLYLPDNAERPRRDGSLEGWINLERARAPRPFPHPMRDLWERYRPRFTGSVKATALIRYQAAKSTPPSELSPGNRELAALFLEGRPSHLWSERLRPFGLGHLLAISGLHCGFVFIGLQLLLFPLRRPVLRALLTVLGLVLFAHWIGWTASVTRASLMLIAWTLLPTIGRQRSWLRLWAALGLILLLGDPLMLVSQGYWYSFAASLGLILGMKHEWSGPLEHPWLRRCRFALPIVAAQLFVIPINLMFGHTTALTDMIWNLFGVVALCVLAVLMLCALAAMLVGALVPFANALEGGVAGTMAGIAEMPAVATLVRLPVAPTLVLVTLGLLALVLAVAGRERRWYAAVGIVVLFGFLGVPRQGDRLLMLDVGQGLSLLHVDRSGGATLVDAGGRLPPRTTLEHLLRLHGATHLRAVFVTHLDNDHYGFLEASGSVPVYVAANSLDRAREDPVLGSFPIIPVSPGDCFRIGPYRVTALWPPADANPPDDNENSLVLDLRGDDFSLLITGDAGRYVEQRLGDLDPSGTRVLQVGHHGSQSASSLHFLSAFAPDLALISCGYRNRFNHPHPRVVARLEAIGARVLTTARYGTIAIARDGRLEPIRSVDVSSKDSLVSGLLW